MFTQYKHNSWIKFRDPSEGFSLIDLLSVETLTQALKTRLD